MNISEHINHFEHEMKRRNYSSQTIEIYTSCLKVFFGQSKKDHPKNINESDIRDFLSGIPVTNTQRGYHSAIKKFYEICLHQKDKFKYIPYARKESKLPIVLSVAEIKDFWLTVLKCGGKVFNYCRFSRCYAKVWQLQNFKL